MATGTKLPKGMYQICGCRSDKTHCESHALWGGYKPRGKARVRASIDDLARREVRKLADGIVVFNALKAAIDNGSYVPKARLRGDEPTVADAMDAYVEHHYVGTDIVIVPAGAREKGDNERYLDWLYSVIQAHIDAKAGDPDAIERAKVDRSRLSKPRLLVRRWGSIKVAALALGHLRAFHTWLRQPGLLRPTSRKPELRSVGAIVRIMTVATHFGDWIAEHGPTPEAMRYVRRPPFRDPDNQKLYIPLDDVDDARTRRCPPDEEARLHAAATAHAYPWLSDLIVFAIDTMMRKNELRRLRIRDLDKPSWIKVVGRMKRATKTQRAGSRVNKTSTDREVPICTTRLREVVDRWRLDASGRIKLADEYLFCDGTGERPIRDWSYQWEIIKLMAHGWQFEARVIVEGGAQLTKVNLPLPKILSLRGGKLSDACAAALDEIDLRWHDLRAEGISRAFDADVPRSHVARTAGNPSCVDRYDRKREDAVFTAFQRMERAAAEVVTIMSSSDKEDTRRSAA